MGDRSLVTDHMQRVGKTIGVSVCPIIGGLSEVKQNRLLRQYPDVVVATPGRLWKLLEQRCTPRLENLYGVRFLVIDEADRMVEQVSPCVYWHYRITANLYVHRMNMLPPVPLRSFISCLKKTHVTRGIQKAPT